MSAAKRLRNDLRGKFEILMLQEMIWQIPWRIEFILHLETEERAIEENQPFRSVLVIHFR